MIFSPEPDDQTDLVSVAADIVSAYVSNNPLPVGELPQLIGDTYAALQGISTPVAPAAVKLEPAVSIKKSVTPDYIICLEDGKRFKSLKRHIGTHYNLSPDEYRQKWSLPSDYPMVAPNYAAARSLLAKSSGLGRKVAAPVPAVAEKPKRATRAAPATTSAVAVKSPVKKQHRASAKA
ncbi:MULTISPECIES: MucR family transcriptional regulator [Aminobacter]|uniref:Transcriptional regulator n=1 Tax=Aminobacter ciceronei TaxID=150723 RepID=A0ABR6CBX1_9HYPH|nr:MULTISPECIES: MucR family transcriptional regulator [Aminobacter]MBA8908278.1 putative transcriptional regulator [Aminobacter ciceronei]MBA9022050.1 putative transcriptional regulator [Aminobacter ciceronei]MRX34593.1 MucR family transcriptional regulator [Aminobacter sp. MDW-2]QNH34809.1 MucR family transcriptional regulator [Aminobacter sp. MDW-2]